MPLLHKCSLDATLFFTISYLLVILFQTRSFFPQNDSCISFYLIMLGRFLIETLFCQNSVNTNAIVRLIIRIKRSPSILNFFVKKSSIFFHVFLENKFLIIFRKYFFGIIFFVFDDVVLLFVVIVGPTMLKTDEHFIPDTQFFNQNKYKMLFFFFGRM